MRSAVLAAVLAVVVLGGGVAYAYAADKAGEKPKPPAADPLQHLTNLIQAQASCSEIRAAAAAVPDLPKDIAAKLDVLCPAASSPATPPGPAPAAAPVVTPAAPMAVDVAALEERLAEMLLLPDPSTVCAQMQALVTAIEANGGIVPQSAKDVIMQTCSPDKGNGGLPPGWTQAP